MSIVSNSMPYCCTAKILAGFDETNVAGVGSAITPRKQTLKDSVIDKENYWRSLGEAILVATLNSDQKVAAKVLEELGWKSSGFGHSGKHDTKVSVWFKVLRPVEGGE